MSSLRSPGGWHRWTDLRLLTGLPAAVDRLQARGGATPVELGTCPVVYVAEPELARAVLDARADGIAERGRFYRDVARVIGHASLVTAEGDLHHRLRRAVAPAFRPEAIAAYGNTTVERLLALSASWAEGAEVAVGPEMARLALDIAARSLFGTDLGEELDDFSTVLASGTRIFYREALPPRMAEVLWSARWSPANRRLAASRERIEALVDRLVAARRRSGPRRGPPANLLDALLASRDVGGRPLTHDEIRDQVVTFLFAGHETTAQALTWSLVLLARHPEAEDRLVAELRATIGCRPPEPADLPELVFTRAVVRETLRLYPPAWFLAREASVPTRLAGCPVPVGAMVMVSPLGLQRDPAHWDRPGVFDPGRWLGTEEIAAAYLPFGHGRRNCVGSAFALAELPLVLAALLGEWRVEVRRPELVAARPSVTLRPAGRVVATVHRRRSGRRDVPPQPGPAGAGTNAARPGRPAPRRHPRGGGSAR